MPRITAEDLMRIYPTYRRDRDPEKVQEIIDLVEKHAERTGFPIEEALALVKIESDFRDLDYPDRWGPFSIRKVAVDDLRDKGIPVDLSTLEGRIAAGLDYLKLLRDRYGRTGDNLYVSYYAGIGNIPKNAQEFSEEPIYGQISPAERNRRFNTFLNDITSYIASQEPQDSGEVEEAPPTPEETSPPAVQERTWQDTRRDIQDRLLSFNFGQGPGEVEEAPSTPAEETSSPAVQERTWQDTRRDIQDRVLSFNFGQDHQEVETEEGPAQPGPSSIQQEAVTQAEPLLPPADSFSKQTSSAPSSAPSTMLPGGSETVEEVVTEGVPEPLFPPGAVPQPRQRPEAPIVSGGVPTQETEPPPIRVPQTMPDPPVPFEMPPANQGIDPDLWEVLTGVRPPEPTITDEEPMLFGWERALQEYREGFSILSPKEQLFGPYYHLLGDYVLLGPAFLEGIFYSQNIFNIEEISEEYDFDVPPWAINTARITGEVARMIPEAMLAGSVVNAVRGIGWIGRGLTWTSRGIDRMTRAIPWFNRAVTSPMAGHLVQEAAEGLTFAAIDYFLAPEERKPDMADALFYAGQFAGGRAGREAFVGALKRVLPNAGVVTQHMVGFIGDTVGDAASLLVMSGGDPDIIFNEDFLIETIAIGMVHTLQLGIISGDIHPRPDVVHHTTRAREAMDIYERTGSRQAYQEMWHHIDRAYELSAPEGMELAAWANRLEQSTLVRWRGEFNATREAALARQQHRADLGMSPAMEQYLRGFETQVEGARARQAREYASDIPRLGESRYGAPVEPPRPPVPEPLRAPEPVRIGEKVDFDFPRLPNVGLRPVEPPRRLPEVKDLPPRDVRPVEPTRRLPEAKTLPPRDLSPVEPTRRLPEAKELPPRDLSPVEPPRWLPEVRELPPEARRRKVYNQKTGDIVDIEFDSGLEVMIFDYAVLSRSFSDDLLFKTRYELAFRDIMGIPKHVDLDMVAQDFHRRVMEQVEALPPRPRITDTDTPRDPDIIRDTEVTHDPADMIHDDDTPRETESTRDTGTVTDMSDVDAEWDAQVIRGTSTQEGVTSRDPDTIHDAETAREGEGIQSQEGEIVRDVDSTRDAEPTRDTEPTRDVETTRDVEVVREDEGTRDTETVKDAESVRDAESAREGDEPKDGEGAKDSETVRDEDSTKDAEVARDGDDAKEGEAAQDAESVKDAESTKDAETAKDVESTREAETTKDPDVIKDGEPDTTPTQEPVRIPRITDPLTPSPRQGRVPTLSDTTPGQTTPQRQIPERDPSRQYRDTTELEEDLRRRIEGYREYLLKHQGEISIEELVRLQEVYRPADGFSINTTRMGTSGEALDAIKRLADIVKDTSVRSHAEVTAEAKKLASDLGVLQEKVGVLSEVLKDASETLTAYRALVVAHGAELIAKRDALLRLGDNATPLELAQFELALQTQAELVRLDTELLTNLARAQSAGRIHVEDSWVPLEQLSYDQLLRSPDAQLKVAEIIAAGGGKKAILNKAQQLEDVRTLGDLNRKAQTVVLDRPWQRYFVELRRANLLSGVGRGLRDALSQAAHILLEHSTNFLNAGLNKLRRNRGGMTFGEATARLIGELHGMVASVTNPILTVREAQNLIRHVQGPSNLQLLGMALHDPERLLTILNDTSLSPRMMAEGQVEFYGTRSTLGQTRTGRLITGVLDVVGKPLEWGGRLVGADIHQPLSNLIWKGFDYVNALNRLAGFGAVELVDRPFTYGGYYSGLAGEIHRYKRLNPGVDTKELWDQVIALRQQKMIEARGGDPNPELSKILEGLSAERLELINKIDEAAFANAQHMTWKDPLDHGALRELERFINRHPMLQLGLVPFFHTPAKIMEKALEYTPGLNLINRRFRDDLLGRTTPEAQNRALAAMAIGGVLYVIGWNLAMENRITGTFSPEEAERMREAGIPENSIKIGDKWYSMHGLDPAPAFFLGMMADLVKVYRELEDEDERLGAAASVIVSLARNTLNKNWLNSVTDFLDMASRGRGEERWWNNFLDTMIPFTGLRRSLTEYQFLGFNPLYSEYQLERSSLVDRLAPSRVALDSYGKPRANTHTFGMRYGEETTSPIRQYVANLGMNLSGFDRVLEGVELTDEEYWELRRSMETELKAEDHMNRVVTQPGFDRLSADQQRTKIRLEWEKLKNEARRRFAARPEIRARIREASIERQRESLLSKPITDWFGSSSSTSSGSSLRSSKPSSPSQYYDFSFLYGDN